MIGPVTDSPQKAVPQGEHAAWAVGLTGGSWELAEIAPHLDAGIRLTQRDDGWELSGPQFAERGEPSEILALARELVGLLNGIARVRLDSPEPISGGNVRRYREDGSKDVWVFPEPIAVKARVGTPTIAINGVAVAPRSWVPDLELAARDLRVQGVLAFLGTAPTWHTLYAALDTINKDPRTGRRAGVTRWAGVSHARLRTFTATANSFTAIGVLARHGPAPDPPRETMRFEDALELVRHIAGRWLEELHRLGA
jgi:hypothetical protein